MNKIIWNWTVVNMGNTFTLWRSMYNVITKSHCLSFMQTHVVKKLYTSKSSRRKYLCDTCPCMYTHIHMCMRTSRNSDFMIKALWAKFVYPSELPVLSILNISIIMSVSFMEMSELNEMIYMKICSSCGTCDTELSPLLFSSLFLLIMNLALHYSFWRSNSSR